MASVLKGYFRELQVPLFPTDNYKAFISCTREAAYLDPWLNSVSPLQARKTLAIVWRAFRTRSLWSTLL